MASAPKSNASYLAIKQARDLIQKHGTQAVPLHLRNAPTQLMKDMNHGKDYRYPHERPDHFIDVNYMPDNVDETFYKPTELGHEKFISEHLSKLWPKKFKK